MAELRSAAKLRFEVGIARLDDEEIVQVVESWQSYRELPSPTLARSSDAVLVPCLQSDAAKDSIRSALSLFICGWIAVDKYTLLPTK